MFINKIEDAYSEAEYRVEMQNLIRREKMDLVMPEAMRENDIEMWMHVIRVGSGDSFVLDFGGNGGYFIFTDKGEKGIEKAFFRSGLDGVADESIFDVMGEESEVGEYVKKHNPKNIAINMSIWQSHVDGLSYNGYNKLCEMIGEDNSKKLVSADKVMTDYISRRIQSEIVLYGKICDTQRRLMERGLRSIIPGRTTREELAYFAHSFLIEEGIPVNEFGVYRGPQIMHSDVSSPEQYEKLDYILQKGDFIFWDWGYKFMNFGTDFKRNAYLLKDDEVELPSYYEKSWNYTLKARDILKRTIKSGKTGAETLKNVVSAIEEAGFIHTPFEACPEESEQILGSNEKPGFAMDFHTLCASGCDHAVGAPIAPQRRLRSDFIIPTNQFIAFEFAINTWVPEWNKRMLMDYEENVVITPRGCEFLYPCKRKIILVK